MFQGSFHLFLRDEDNFLDKEPKKPVLAKQYIIDSHVV